MSLKLSEQQKALIKKELIKAGAIPREQTLTPRDNYYSQSLGEKNKDTVKVRF